MKNEQQQKPNQRLPLCFIQPVTIQCSRLNMYHIYDKEKFNESVLNLQRKRKNWWINFLNRPEYLNFKNDTNNFTLNYDKDFDLEYFHIKSQVDQPHEILLNYKNFNPNTELIQTYIDTSELLTSLVHDSMVKRQLCKNLVFKLNIRIAPYKACICLSKKLPDVEHVANDFSKLFESENINILKTFYENDEELQSSVYTELDEYGVPFSIVLNESSLKYGYCLIRNRDNTLVENVNVRTVVQDFKDMMLSLV